ncbi:MAG: hypothetical protein ACXVZH_11580 [Terriglobales bacterium]
MPGKKHSQNIREGAIGREVARVSFCITFVPCRYLLLYNLPYRQVIRSNLGKEHGRKQHQGKN